MPSQSGALRSGGALIKKSKVPLSFAVSAGMSMLAAKLPVGTMDRGEIGAGSSPRIETKGSKSNICLLAERVEGVGRRHEG